MYKSIIIVVLLFSIQAAAAPVPVAPSDAEKKKIMQEPLQSLADSGQMTPGKMLLILKDIVPDVQHEGNQMYFQLGQFQVLLIFDTTADRMRLIVPIMSQKDLQEEQLLQAMQANFHSVLDVRYAVSNDLVFSVFVHPLSSLDEELFRSAIQQVVVAAATFGEEYSSGPYVFPAGEDASNKDQDKNQP
ncbi:type III secretion system chaperone [Marinicella sp. W31]|uniref:type III secretion system chaperone n=1 Tax=Marinicella sp. W31 TaxID=3023713 RepID=UPI003756A0EB